jgi:penicillin-binding protein 2
MTEFQVQVRQYIFLIFVLAAFAVLTTQLYNLQVVQGETYRELADANRFRLAQIPAARGVIYDRNDELLVRNRPVYNVVVIPAYLPEDATTEAQIFARLSELLDLPITTRIEPVSSKNNGYFQGINHHQYTRQIENQIINPRSRRYANAPLGIRDAVNQNRTFAPFLPVTIARDVDPEIVALIEEERINLPGVLVEITPSRDYIHSELTSHILGYTGPIPAELYDQYDAEGYDLTDIIGLAGLEIEYEEWLRGIKGLESIEVDVTGQKIRTVSQNVEARPGHNLRLSLDMELQQVTTEALQEEMDRVGSPQGAAVVMNPQNGEVLAMVTLPSFDNNLFVQGITPRELSLLSEDRWTPLVNHATAGLYPPGSVFKIIPAAGALQERTVQPETTFFDSGVLLLPNRFEPDNEELAQPFYCWLRSGHGEVNIVSGLAWSCNVYFHQIGGGYYPANYEGLGQENMERYAEMFGLGQPTNIDLPGELGGLVPNAKWKRLNYAETWLTGDTYNMAIGQGFVLVTPLQMANAYASIANGGTLYQPRLVKEILDADGNVVKVTEPEVIGSIDLDPEFMNLVRAGLRAVVDWDSGTAHDTFDVPGIDASGKTGTAEFCDDYPACLDREGRVKTSHAWFASYAPTNNPEIVTMVFVYGGGEGSQVAVPVTNKILRHYFNIQDEEEEDQQDSDQPEEELSPDTLFITRLLGADTWPQDSAAVTGYVLGAQNQGLANITVTVYAAGEPMAEVATDAEGQFVVTNMDAEESRSWRIQLAGYPNSSPVDLQIAAGLRYMVEFQAQLAPLESAAVIPAQP